MMWAFPWLVSTVLMVWLFVRLDRTRQSLSMEKSRNHAMCIAAVFAAISEATAARALRDAAAKWESVEEQPHIKILANARYTPGGMSVPALWLLDEAARLDPQKQEVEV